MIFRAAYFVIFLHFLRITLGKLMVTPSDDKAVCYDAGSGTIVVLGRARVGATSERGVFKIYSMNELRKSPRAVATAYAVMYAIMPYPPGLDYGKLNSLYQAMCVKYNRQQWCSDFVYNVNKEKNK